MRLSEATPLDILDVARRMREADFREFSALIPANDREDLAQTLVRRYGGLRVATTAWYDDRPVAIGAAVNPRPNVVSVLFFATDEFPRVAVAMTRFITRTLMPQLISDGVHRIECVSIEGHDEAHRWIELCGLRKEGTLLRKFGIGGEDFYSFAKVV